MSKRCHHSSLSSLFTIHLPKRWKSRFLKDLNLKIFPGEPTDPLHCIPTVILKTLISVFGSRVSRRFSDKWMEGWQGHNRRRGMFFVKLFSNFL